MTRARTALRRLRYPLVAAAALAGVLVYALNAGAVPVPVPDAVVIVKTKSGSVERTSLVPIGGAPIPIDVDGPPLTGLLQPDIDVSVGLVALEELPGKPIVPNVVVRRNALALATDRPNPPLELDAKIVLRDAANGLKPLVEVHYGFKTPPGGRIPPVITAKLVGPIQGGFVDPLQAKVESPGFSGPLNLRLEARTDDLDAKFGFDFDALPESIFISQDPREDGLDVLYEHAAPVADVHLDAFASLRNRETDELLEVGAEVERLPQRITLSNTNTEDTTLLDYDSSSALNRPDLEATYRDLDGDGGVVTDANVKVAALPPAMGGRIDTVEEDGERTIDKVDFRVLGSDEIGAVDFLVRNFDGPAGNVPAPQLGPDQFVAVASRRQPDGSTRFRAAGRLLGIRSATVERQGDENDVLDARTDVGDGVRPLRAVVDLDDRGPGAEDDAQRMKVDTTLTPLPRQIHAVFDPSTGDDDSMRLLYESSATLDVTADALIASGEADGCGEADVVCAGARIDKVPRTLEALLPGTDGTDFSLSHDGGATQRPDVRAIVDATDEDAKRTWADVRILRVPNEVTGRLDSGGGVVRAAEFHACEWDFTATPPACTTPQQAIGRVSFTVRDRPSRAGLPPRRDTAPTYVSLIKRDDRFEASGRVDEVRHVEFRQRDADPGTLGALVDVGSSVPFDTAVDSVDGSETTDVKVHVAQLPDRFTACVRKTIEAAQPAGLPADTLLTPCETNQLDADPDEPVVTPITAIYTASDDTDVTANVRLVKPNPDDGNRLETTSVNTEILPLPDELRADVVPPITPTRKMKLLYQASEEVPKVKFGFESRRASDICEDPRPHRKALCVEGDLLHLPTRLEAVFNPNESEGDITFTSSEPAGADKLSLNPFRLSKVAPEDDAQPLLLDAKIEGITQRMEGKLVQLHTPSDPPGEKSMAALAFDACPGDDPSCTGIDDITFTATNALIGDPLPAEPAPDADTTQDFSFVQRGVDFRAKGAISDFKEIGLTKLKGDGTPGPTTRVRAAFGDGTSNEKLRAFIDRETVTDPETNSGLERQIAHAVISDAPKAINLCFRDTVAASEVAPDNLQGADFCDKAPADKLAVQARLDEPAGGAKPDIDIRRLRLEKGGGTDFLDGTIFIRNLAQRIDALAGKGEETSIIVEGHDIDDPIGAPPKNVADRVTFNLRNYEGDDSGTGEFPFVSLNGAVDPEDDTRVDVGSEQNFVKVVKDVDTLLLKGSIPGVKRIELRPGEPCEVNARFPAADAFPTPEVRPSYTCVNLIAAEGQPLGLAIRTRDDKNEILSMDEGFIDSVPAGEGGLLATLGKSPDGAKLNANCGEGASGTAAAGCRPPLLSVKAPKGPGQTTNLQARLATGPEHLIDIVKAVEPLDAYSQRLDYEQTVKNYEKRGARLKLGTGEAGDAVRVGFNLDLPAFLDLDQPQTYTCKRDDLDGGPLDPSSAACKQTDVTSLDNNGFESKDIAVRLVGSNTGHLGTDLPSLGRAAVLVHSLDDGKQTIITGAHPADPNNNGLVADNPLASHPEADPPTGDHDLGLNLPGYLDARVFIRSKYEAPNENDKQTVFYQVDGRTNAPLTLGLRDVQSAALDGTLQTGRTRSGKDVAALSLAVRNAPGVAAGGDFVKPSFRVRAEMRKKHAEAEVGPYKCEGFNPGGGRTAGFGANFCLYVPGDHIEKWLDVGLNMNPDEGSAPARTVDVVMDSIDYTQIDMRAFDSVAPDPAFGDFGKGNPAKFTPQAGLRLQPFPIGLEIGLGLGIVGGNTLMLLDGDLILKLSGRSPSRLRLSQNVGGLRLLAEGGGGGNEGAYVRTHNETEAIVQVRAEALFGLISELVVDAHTPDYHQPVQFKTCEFPNLGIFVGSNDFFPVDRGDSTKTAIVLPPGHIPPGFASAAEVLTAASEVLAPIWCLLSTDDNALVDGAHPAPAYTEPGRDIIGTVEAPPPVTTPPTPPPPAPADLTVGDGDGVAEASDTITLCETQQFKNLVVETDGRIDVGDEGTSYVDTITTGEGTLNITVECDGSLDLRADSIEVKSGGVIDGNATRVVTSGPGTPGGTGGGAGHSGVGGGAAGGGGGGTYTGASMLADFGSRGAGPNGGHGGGTIRMTATDTITVAGSVQTNGGPGGDFGSGCTTAGGGGGSGGRVELTANLVTVAGSVQARGGRGGNAGDSGGGGGGGRIGVNTVAPAPAAANLQANGGAAGTSPGGSGCVTGGAGASGNNGLGTVLNHAAGVTFNTTADVPPTYVENSVPLRLSAVKNGGGRLKVIVCKRSVGPAGSIEDVALNPPNTLTAAISAANCTSEDFVGPTSGTNRYLRNSNRPVTDGFHGFYAVAATPPSGTPGEDCLQPSSDGCTYQSTVPGGTVVLPTVAQVKIASDDTGPDVSFSNASGEPGCVGGRLCLDKAGTMAVQAEDTTGGVGLGGVFCRINGSGDFDIPCGPGDNVTVDFGTSDGIKDIEIRAIDELGNATTIAGPQWVVDRTAGNVPAVTMTQTDATPTNGWYQSKPTITVHAEDGGAGFAGVPITLFTDTSSHKCGTISGGGTVADCSATETEPFVPDQGIHTFQAEATDRLGNKTLKSNVETMKVDGIDPKVSIFVGPKKPDGKDQWYVTTPFVAFGAVDNVGGSGVNISHESGVSKIEYRVDGGSFQAWDPDDPNLLEDGVHEVCYRATDLAGNTSPTECRGNIKVDTTPPGADDPISPALPDGDNAFYVSTPTVDATGEDPQPPGVGQVSGLNRVEQQVDDADWRPAAPTPIAEGEHVVRARAFDNAGNASQIRERTVRVDRSDPSASLKSHPPAPNDQGWFRRPVVNSIAAHDGRDGSGADGATFGIDGPPAVPYLGPFTVADGQHTVTARPRDRAGRQGPVAQATQRIDTQAPSGAPTGRTPLLSIPLLGLPNPVPLRFTASDQLTPRVKVQVLVYGALGNLVRRLPVPGPHPGGYRDPGAGSVGWNGHNSAGYGVIAGAYHYRVHVTDQAGNTVLSDESPTFLVVLGVL